MGLFHDLPIAPDERVRDPTPAWSPPLIVGCPTCGAHRHYEAWFCRCKECGQRLELREHPGGFRLWSMEPWTEGDPLLGNPLVRASYHFEFLGMPRRDPRPASPYRYRVERFRKPLPATSCIKGLVGEDTRLSHEPGRRPEGVLDWRPGDPLPDGRPVVLCEAPGDLKEQITRFSSLRGWFRILEVGTEHPVNGAAAMLPVCPHCEQLLGASAVSFPPECEHCGEIVWIEREGRGRRAYAFYPFVAGQALRRGDVVLIRRGGRRRRLFSYERVTDEHRAIAADPHKAWTNHRVRILNVAYTGAAPGAEK